MNDIYNKSFGRGKRVKRGKRGDGFYGERDEYYKDDFSPTNSQPQMKAPVILAKTNRDTPVTSGSPHSQSELEWGRNQDSAIGRTLTDTDNFSQPTPVIMVRPKDDTVVNPPTLLTRPKSSQNDDHAASVAGPSYQLQQRKGNSSAGNSTTSQQSSQHQPTLKLRSPMTIQGGASNRMTVVPRMKQSAKLIDDSLSWCDGGMEMLVDQTDFMSVGVLGMQGVGKSTLLSLLAENNFFDSYKEFAFKPQTKEMKEVGAHQTMGIDMFVTPERILLLDAQPILSISVMDYLLRHEKKYPPEFTTAENCVEMQSLQLAAFLMTVCNVVIIVMDWFVDLDLLNFIQTAEMLKPSTPTTGQDSNSSDNPEYYPYLVFVLNKADRESFSLENYRAMQEVFMKIFERSKLKFRGPLTIANGKLIPGLNRNTIQHNVNLFLFPVVEDPNSLRFDDPEYEKISNYNGHPGFNNLLRAFRNKLLSMPRKLLTHTTLSEKNWFHYAARTWEAIKKSSLFVEYNRLLP